MHHLRALFFAVVLTFFMAPWPVFAALAPDAYLPTINELPPGIELQQAQGAKPVGINGGVEETRVYSSMSPPAIVYVSVSVLDAQMAPQRYGSGLSAYFRQGFIASRSNTRTDGYDVEIVQTGQELNRHVRFLLAGSVTGSVTVLYNNTMATAADAGALAESIAGPLLLRMLAHPDGV